MERLILESYKGLTITALMVFILAVTVLLKCHKDEDYGSTFRLSLAISGWMFGEFLMRAWWTVWKSRYISREPSQWMQDHEIVLFSSYLMIGSGIYLIKALTEDSPYGRLWKLCAIVVGCVMMLGMMK